VIFPVGLIPFPWVSNMKYIDDMTLEEFKKVPHRRSFDEDVGLFDSLVILPVEINKKSLLIYKFRKFLHRICKWFKEPEVYEIDGLHGSGFRLMDFVAVEDGHPICRLSGCSDVLHLDGIGGFGYNWIAKGDVPKLIPPKGWRIDCLPKSGLLRIWPSSQKYKKLIAGAALSSFEISAVTKSNNDVKRSSSSSKWVIS